MRKASRSISFLVFLTVLQTAQGFFAGAALCREETGGVTLEWARDGQCESPGVPGIQCLEAKTLPEEHCGPCFDIPLPSETSLKSAAVSAGLFAPGLLAYFEFAPIESFEALPAPTSPTGSLVSGPPGSVRLLI